MKIGMYDSGIGGLTVAKEVLKKIPNADIIYVADNYNVPYGDKEACEIRNFSCEISRFLLGEGAETICVACNMSTAVSLDKLKEIYPDKKIYGTIEFGAKEALKFSDKIGVIATAGTVKSGAYTKYIQKLNNNATIVEEPCPEFVPLVESGRCDSEEAFISVRDHIENILEKSKIGVLVLGCTHYPYLENQIIKVLPKNVKIVNPAIAMAEFLEKENAYQGKGTFTCYATKDKENVSLVCETIGAGADCQNLFWEKGKLVKCLQIY